MQEGAQLRPLGVGDIVDRVFGIYRQRPLMFLTVAAIPELILYLAVGVMVATFAGGAMIELIPLLTGDVTAPELGLDRLVRLLATILPFAGVVAIVAIAVSLMQSASLVASMAARYMGRETTAGEALRIGLRRSGDLLVMGLIAFLAFIGMWVALIVVMALTQQWWSVLSGTVFGCVASVYLAASWMVSPAVVVLERAGQVEALRRSWSLARSNRWRIIGLVLLLLILEIVLSSLLSFVLLASFVTDQIAHLVLQQAVNLLASVAWAPVYWGTFAVLYYDLRVRREALDLQLAAESLPRAT